jgi:hypothetical protein
MDMVRVRVMLRVRLWFGIPKIIVMLLSVWLANNQTNLVRGCFSGVTMTTKQALSVPIPEAFPMLV